ncbi:MAG: MCE family protein [Actinomycetota bacterium]|nr:MCE family protein [Actinomycetota bacterium]
MGRLRVLGGRRLASAAAVAAGALVASGCGVSLQALPKPGGISGPTYTVHATFANVVNLPASAEVRIGAFAVGYVSALDAKDFQAQVTMKIKQSQKIPAATTAEVRFDTPLGEDYITLVQPSNVAQGAPVTKASPNVDYLTDGSSIPETATSTAPSVEDVFAALGALLNNGGIDQLQTIITEINNAFGGNQPQIHDLITKLNVAVSSFATNTPRLDSTLQQLAGLSTTLNNGSSTIVAGLDALAPAVTDLKNDSASFDNLVSQVGDLSKVANGVVTRSQTGLMQTLKALSPVLTQLTNVQGQLGPALNAIDELQVRTPSIAPGNYLQVAINANVQVPPVPPGALPLQKVTVDPPDPNQSYARNGIATLLEGGLP